MLEVYNNCFVLKTREETAHACMTTSFAITPDLSEEVIEQFPLQHNRCSLLCLLSRA